ncbi:MAG TPA: NAD(P)/FAD-dependent oxidoreductase [Acidimicrobiales bacterium]|nr:NAD(P)/FAD-dependent oxidoreductase [Acidimicrobiales bacterium]
MVVSDAFTSSPFVGAVEPIVADDEEIRRHLAAAEVPPLLPALAYVTGDLSLLRDHLRPDPALSALPQGGLSEEQQAEIRRLALDVLVAFRDGGSRPAPLPSDDDVLRIMEYAVGGSDMGEYLPLLEEELAHRGEDPRAPGWRLDEVAPDVDLRVAIIGAGMSGILAAHRLQQAGVPFVVLEKNDDLGGTWYENAYPGCRVDNPNHNYSYSFAQRHDWPAHFSTQDVLHGYLRDCVEAFCLRDHIRLGTEVVSCTWSEDDQRWTLELRGGEPVVVHAVVSAVGQLNRPRLPDIPGRATFNGPAFHSARWDPDVDLRGKRVAVIGTGASAVQIIPEIAPVVGELTVFQRTPPWLVPTPDYHDAVAPGLRWLYDHVPSYSEWNRFCIFWRMGDAVLESVRVDESFEPGDGSPAVSEMNELVRQMFTLYLGMEFADRPDLLPAVVPTYPPGAKRMLRDNGVWAAALKRDNVRLVGGSIRQITPTGIVTEDGEAHDVDVILYGTGFTASEFLMPMTVTGRDGVDLHGRWAGEARAYLGVTVPGFPNLFCLYGPNTNIVINGSIVYFSECGVRYILGCLRLLLESGHGALDVRPDVHDRFNAEVDAENRRMAWGVSDVNSWYKNASGRVSQNWPFTLLEYWRRTLRPDPDDYEMSGVLPKGERDL